MLETVKNALRVKSAAFDGEIGGIIAACFADLRLAGVEFEDMPADGDSQTDEGADEQDPDPQNPAETPQTPEIDPLIIRGLILYAKANFGYDGEAERYKRAYDDLKCRLMLRGDMAGGDSP